VELLEAIDVAEIGRRLSPDNAEFVSTALENVIRRSAEYLKEIAGTFPEAVVRHSGASGARDSANLKSGSFFIGSHGRQQL
jgi:hypothetical protein